MIVIDHPAPLKVSGGGAGQFETHGGDNSIQEYGEESSESELTEAAEALHGYLVAFASNDWQAACLYMAENLTRSLERFGAEAKGSKKMSCPELAAGLFGAVGRSSKERRELTEVDAGSLRREGDQAFLIYHGPEYDAGNYYGPSDVYAMPMKFEGDEWKVGAAIGNEMGIGRRALQH